MKVINKLKKENKKVSDDLQKQLAEVKKAMNEIRKNEAKEKINKKVEGKGKAVEGKVKDDKGKTEVNEKTNIQKRGVKRLEGGTDIKKEKEVKVEIIDVFMNNSIDRLGKRRKNTFKEELKFNIEKDVEKISFIIITIEKRSAVYYKIIKISVVIQLRGQAFIFKAGQNLGTQSQTFWNKVKEMLKVIDRHMPEVDKVPNMLDATGQR